MKNPITNINLRQQQLKEEATMMMALILKADASMS